MQLSDSHEIMLLDGDYNDPVYAAVSTPFLAICLNTPIDTETGTTITEPAYSAYARKAIAAVDMNAAATGAKDNANVLAFPESDGGSEVLKAWALVSASTVGDLIRWGMLTVAGTLSRGIADHLDGTSTLHIPAHGFSVSDQLVVDFEGTIGGIARDTEYNVATVPDANSVTITGLTLTGSGHIVVGESAWRTINSGITPQFSAGALVNRNR